ncbi:DUF4440 domain-containing protein [Mariniblastus sp.]|nr:DUF4440 domain-containing protein [Mariniblastus sp.]MDB4380627.1 DUF4440 domain-containing protein [Mariniblastus sp.]MDC3224953.1 DUF4440 domain-containing protein [Mariniblastus sp.]
MHYNYLNSTVNLSFLLILGLSSFMVEGVFGQAVHQKDVDRIDYLQKELEGMLATQVTAWNAGNLEKFMDTYWKSPKLTFSSGGKTSFGWQATLDNYKKAYPTPEKMGKLHFDQLEVNRIEKNSALVLGHWHLRMSEGQQRDGNFTLIIKKIDEQWKIIHDHSSELKKTTEK